ncbi:MAG TPA: gliding motility-associated C-terminal domain-containing protein, partial [Bacteroidales bacterium]|nr:gliding motility-associated C-terminal domain-containing protein [Bacteroidales bacterium]
TTSGTFDPATAGVGAHEIIYTTSGSCGDADTIDVVVSAVTDAAMNPAGPFCASDAAVTLTAVNAGGIWAGTGITNTASGIFDPVVAGVGTHEITYTTTGACPDTDTMDVVVSAFLDATITPAGPFCATDTPVTLSAATSGGIWSGTGITNTTSGTFDPATAGVGAHEIIYTTSGSCGDADTIQIQVVSQMDATIAVAGPFCDNEAAVVLSAANTGGVWSGPGITNTATGAFDPSVAGSGTHEIFYTISGSCGDADSIDIVVYESPEFTYVSTDESCTGAGDGSIVLTVTGGVNPITYTWSNGSATVSLDGIGEGSYSVTVSDAHGCSRNATITLGDPGVPCDDITPHAVVPNAFSPNGDGENDMLYVRGEGITQLSFIVYDRWGEKVFSTTSLNNGWDGTFRGKELDPAVFTYYLHAIFMDGTDKIEKGDVTLTR